MHVYLITVDMLYIYITCTDTPVYLITVAGNRRGIAGAPWSPRVALGSTRSEPRREAAGGPNRSDRSGPARPRSANERARRGSGRALGLCGDARAGRLADGARADLRVAGPDCLTQFRLSPSASHDSQLAR